MAPKKKAKLKAPKPKRKIQLKHVAVVADNSARARRGLEDLCMRYGLMNLEDHDIARARKEIDALVVLGGDGFMLHTMHEFMADRIPLYGMNCGTVGFLLNDYDEEKLLARLEHANATTIRPLKMVAMGEDNVKHHAIAFNEVSLLRQTRQTAHIKVRVDGATQLKQVVCDGILIATPAGSSAYNFSAGGPVLPLNSQALALTPISPFRPRRWRGAVLPHTANMRFDIADFKKRPVSAVADSTEVRHVKWVEVSEARDIAITLLFDPGHGLEERIIKEQFLA